MMHPAETAQCSASPRPASSRRDDPVRLPKAAAAYVGLSESTLAKCRMRGTGPRFIKLSATRVGYRQSALDAWLDERERVSTLEIAS